MRFLTSIILLLIGGYAVANESSHIQLTLIPPTAITNKVNLDIRAGVLNKNTKSEKFIVSLFYDRISDDKLLCRKELVVAPNESAVVKYVMQTQDKIGRRTIILVADDGEKQHILKRNITIEKSDVRSPRRIDGAWVGLYHWSEEEGKHWNKDIKTLTDNDWKDVIRRMHQIGMDIVVIQEVFRNQAYAGKHSLNAKNYSGKAFYPSTLYVDRVDISANDPIEAILSEADKSGMHVFLGVGLFAWFDFSPESLEWHKNVAQELWNKYGHHNSFYGFYVSEESGGSLDNWETDPAMQAKQKDEIVDFFAEFKRFCGAMAPAKPIMLATNSMEVEKGSDAYPRLLEHLDILCPFGFARMPEGDLTGKEAADMLQDFCDKSNAHLWFDLEAFLFNSDTSLYPRDINGIIDDLNLLDNFEKILCYQYPGVFNHPRQNIIIGESKTKELYRLYKEYLKQTKKKRK